MRSLFVRRVFLALSLLILVVVFSALPAHAAKIWTGANSTDWSDNGNWIGGLPVALDDVLITNAANEVLLDTSTPGLTSLTISNNTLTCTNWTTTINATTVDVQSNGVVSVAGHFDNNDMTNRIHIVCQDLTVEQYGRIDADGGGYHATYGPGAGEYRSYYQYGGSHGGRGGCGERKGQAGALFGYTYGDAETPVMPGSGGGTHNSSTYRDSGCAGGGAIYIDASGTVTVHGTISADGESASHATYGWLHGGGSGGSIYIECGTFGGSTDGMIRARGGNALRTHTASGAGGGGRVAVNYSGLSLQYFVRFSVAPGSNDWGRVNLSDRWYQSARKGTLWLPDTALLSDVLSDNQFDECRIMGPTSWSPSSLSVSNCSVAFGTEGFELRVAGEVRIGANGELGIGDEYGGTNFNLYCNSMTLTNGGSLWVYAGHTNDAAFGYGALVKVTNDLAIGPGCWIYPVTEEFLTNAASPRFEMDNLYVAAGGGFNANSKGYAPSQGPGRGADEDGVVSNHSHDGPGHGGYGGASPNLEVNWYNRGGVPYGSVGEPLAPGSGGAQYVNYEPAGGAGGGVVRIVATDTVSVDGTIMADGAEGTNDWCSPGSGGSIYITCNTFGGASSGLLSVKGGNIGEDRDNMGAGAGGRMAVDYNNLETTHDVRFTAAAGERERVTVVFNEIDYHDYRAQEGTLWLPDTALFTEVLDGSRFDEVRLFGPTAWSPSSLTVSNCTVTFAQPGLVIDVPGSVSVDTNAWFGIGDESAGSNVEFHVAGNIVVTNGGGFHVYAGQTGGTGRAYGILVRVTNDLAIGPNSRVHPYSHRSDGGSAKFMVGDLLVAEGGIIDAHARGYGGREGPGKPYAESSRCGAGGGYGGRGGGGGKYKDDTTEGGYPYGSPHKPLLPGSGGLMYSGYYKASEPRHNGGRGGGVVWVEATGAVTVNGTVSADGYDSIAHYAGSGSGGAVYLKCSTLGGSASGLLTARGGDSYEHATESYYGAGVPGGGGGGRIAVDYDSLAATHDMRFSAAPASLSWSYSDVTNEWQLLPRVGTVSLPDAGLLSTSLTSNRFAGAVSLFFQDISSWNPASLTVSNAWVAFGDDDFHVIVDGDVVVDTGGDLGLGHYHDGSNYTLSVGGSLVLTNGGELHVYGGLTNAMGEGEMSALVEVTNDVIVRSGSWIYPSTHDTKGGSPWLRMRHLVIDDGGGIDATAKGYRGTYGPGTGARSPASQRAGGGGHGGKGGDGATAAYGGGIYGPTNGPARPGSGAGTYTASYYETKTGAGGGAVCIESRGSTTVDGTITANGGEYTYLSAYYGAGGAGGGIYIITTNFSGGANGVMQADGASAYGALVGSGGGGRITVWNNVPEQNRTNFLAGGSEPDLQIGEVFEAFWGDVSVTTGAVGWAGEPGTKHYIKIPPAGTWEVRIDGDPTTYDSPTSLGYGVNAGISTNTWITNSVTSPTDEAAGQRWITLGYDLVDYDDNPVADGVATQAAFELTTNMVLTWNWTNQWLLTVGYQGNGSVNSNVVNGWYTNLTSPVGITASPDGGYIFNGWIGDFPAGEATANPLSVTMDQARSITATFAVATIETNIWTGTGLWSNEANWSEGHVPKNIDHTVVKSGELTLDQNKYVASLTVSNGATFLFTNWATTVFVDTDVIVQSNGLVSCWGPFTETQMSNRVNLVCSNLIVEAGGAIDVKDRGYRGASGPGAGEDTSTYYESGGAYGGRGGRGYRQTGDTATTAPYGTPDDPRWPGSGGGSHNTDFYRDAAGAGGGAIRIEAERAVTVNGTIGADGGDTSHFHGAGGSGGGIHILCDILGGNDGIITARGGDAFSDVAYGGGGGGRIAVDYNGLAAQRNIHFAAGPARVDWGQVDLDQRWQHVARMGTLWLPDTNFLASPITDNLFSNCCVYVDGVTTLTLDSLTVSNASFTFPENGFELRIDGDLVLGERGVLGIGDYYEAHGSNYVLAVGGSITLTNGGELHVYAGQTNGAANDAATLVTVTNDVVIGPSSWLVTTCQETNGGSARLVMENLDIASAGGINANARGYISRRGPGIANYVYYMGGPGHGGMGGGSPEPAPGGSTYGNVHAPVTPGSGGGTHDTHRLNGGSGGGVIRVEARSDVNVDGTLMANGASGYNTVHGGGGSGGSVYIQCDSFGGSTGLIQAEGGSAIATNANGSGGGGRIAIDCNSLAGSPSVKFSARSGTNGWAFAPVFFRDRWHHLPQAGTLSLPDDTLLSDTLDDSLLAGAVRFHFKNQSSWNPASLTVNDCDAGFPQDGFELSVPGTVRVDSGGILRLGDDADGSNYVLHCGNLVVTNGGVLHVYAGRTNDSSQAYGTIVTVAQDIVVGPASWIHPWAHRYNGATVQFKADSVLIAAAGGFDANAKGYYSKRGPGRSPNVASGWQVGGAGYGGRGGDGREFDPGDSGSGGSTYGSTNAPTEPGSAAGSYTGSDYDARGGSGGGAVRIDARNRLTLYGTIAADGGMGHFQFYGGGGSGGAIYLFCKTFNSSPSGLLSVDAGDAFDNWAGGGGGGRIAVWEGLTDDQRTTVLTGGLVDRLLVTNDLSAGFNGTFSVDSGKGHVHPDNPPEEGTTVYVYRYAPPGTMIILR